MKGAFLSLRMEEVYGGKKGGVGGMRGQSDEYTSANGLARVKLANEVTYKR